MSCPDEQSPCKTLHDAAQAGHVDCCNRVGFAHINRKSASHNDHTPLTVAAYQGHLEVVQLLLEHGADIAGKAADGDTALGIAAFKGHTAVVLYLISKGADLNVKDNKQFTPLAGAAQCGHLEIAKLLVEHGASVDLTGNAGRTAMFLAVSQGHADIVEYFISKGADVSVKNVNSNAPIHTAAQDGHLEIVKLLVEHGADINSRASNGDSPLGIAAFKGHTAIVLYLIDRGADLNFKDNSQYTPLTSAAQKGHLEIVKLLVEHGATVDLAGNGGVTPLFVASLSGHTSVVEYFISKGADVNTKGGNGNAPIHLAAQDGHLEIVKLLVEHGADINSRASNGDSPLGIAAFKGHIAIVEFLIGKGADLNFKDGQQYTPLLSAVLKGHLAIVKLLVEHGAAVDLAGQGGRTPLCFAAAVGATAVAEYLISKGANINTVNDEGKTPLIIAAANSGAAMSAALVHWGADTTIRGNAGRLAVEAAENDEVRTAIVSAINCACATLRDAAHEGHVRCCRRIGFESVNTLVVNAAEGVVESPLHAAARASQLLTAMLLVEHGADITALNSNGESVFAVTKDPSLSDALAESSWKRAPTVSTFLTLRRQFPNTQRLLPVLSIFDARLPVFRPLIAFEKHLMDSEGTSDEQKNLLAAAILNDRAAAQSLLTSCPELANATITVAGGTALHAACVKKNVEVAEVLLAAGADPNMKDASGMSPAHITAVDANIHLLRLLCDAGADPNVVAGGTTPLQLLHPKAADEFANLAPNPTRVLDEVSGITVLHAAAIRGDKAFVSAAFEKDACTALTCTDNHGLTMLYYALKHSHKEIIKMLLTAHGKTALCRTCAEASACSVAGLSDRRLCAAIEHLLTGGADVAATDDELMTPLHHACGSERAFTLIFARCPDQLLLRDGRGRIPLHHAAMHDCIAVCELLLAERADEQLDAADSSGQLPVHTASATGSTQALSLLLDRRSDMLLAPTTEELGTKMLPLALALKNGYLACAQELLARHADEAKYDWRTWQDALHKRTMLHWAVFGACKSGSVDVVTSVVDATKQLPDPDTTLKAMLASTCADGWTPLEQAEWGGTESGSEAAAAVLRAM